MDWVAYILGIIATALAVWIAIRNKKPETPSRKLLNWKLAVLLVILAAVVYGIEHFPKDSGERIEKTLGSIDSLAKLQDEKISQLTCKMENLEKMLQASVAPGNEEYIDSARVEAECINASQLARSAMDSGLVALGLRHFPEAIIHFQYAIFAAENDSSKALAFANMALTYNLWGDSLSVVEIERAAMKYGEAVALYDSALAYRHNFLTVLYDRGMALAGLGDFEAAVASFDSALACDHRDYMSWCNRGNSLCELGQFEGGVASFDSALKYKHDNPLAWYNRGIALDGLGQFEAAAASFDSALTYKHDFSEAWNRLCAVLVSLGEYKATIVCCDSALKYSPDEHLIIRLRRLLVWITKE